MFVYYDIVNYKQTYKG